MAQKLGQNSKTGLLRGQIFAAHKYLLEHNDEENANKVKQLAGKLAQGEFAIAFCGHFSAGKSRMINSLLGEQILPSSPIPTSANLVKVRLGEKSAKVFFKKEKPRLYYAPYDYEMLKNYCKDGDQIEEIEFSYPHINLPAQTVIMDTPGIDSADEAHRIATESAIYFADLIFYVMDYNHVQSENNFMFIKELTEAEKEVYLVINQIDKHLDKEISFLDFKSSVTQSFKSWGVKAADVFYTSLKEDNHEHNQFKELQSFLIERLEQRDTLLMDSVFNSLQKIIQDHFNFKNQKNEFELRPFKNVLNELSEEAYRTLEENYNKVYREKEVLANSIEEAEEELESGIKSILDNAYLMSFEKRKLAEAFLETRQSGFKVGLFFRKQKTMTEKKKRLDIFYDEMLEITKSQIEWHLRNFLFSFLNKHHIENAQLSIKINTYSVSFSSELLIVMVKSGAVLSNTSVMNYTTDVVNEIKRIAKNSLLEIKDEILVALKNKNKTIQDKLDKRLDDFMYYITALEQVKKYELVEKTEKKKIQLLLNEADFIDEDSSDLFKLVEPDFEVVDEENNEKQEIPKKSNLSSKKKNQCQKKVINPDKSVDRIKQTSEKVQKTAQLIQGLPGFGGLAGELNEKGERLLNKGFKVALFGAFSAGKSSFANALLGESVLPVSPNPMTAAINNIKPVSTLYKHETVIIKLKEETTMLEDVNNSLKLFDVFAETLEEALEIIDNIDDIRSQQGVSQKLSHAFLQAFRHGYSEFDGRLGEILETTMAEFSDYVAKEERSCFVQWIDLYYDCPLTRKGITLVDTPGMDSINNRHTGLAFDYIKNSDVILFVTYYNHAFSKVDREFIIQLGRVKDSFQVDKMFFIINAIDLAESEEEQEIVIEYVQDQLVKYGVRNPNIYALSSLKALQEKKNNSETTDSGLSDFEGSFYNFITHDLTNMVAKDYEDEVKRVYKLVEKLITSTEEDVLVKQKKRENIRTEKYNIDEILTKQTAQGINRLIDQEAGELIFYIKERVFLRFSDFFKESFNSSVLRDDGRDLKKALQNALNELLEQIGFDFAQEMRATTVRLDRLAERAMVEYQRSLIEKTREVNYDISFSAFHFKNEKQINFEIAFKDISQEAFTKALSYFKNTKSFFEKNEKKFTSDEIYSVLNKASDKYLHNQLTKIQNLYKSVIEEQFKKLISQMKEQTESFYLSLFLALEGEISTQELKTIKEKLLALL